jgi:hypothetical protein
MWLKSAKTGRVGPAPCSTRRENAEADACRFGAFLRTSTYLLYFSARSPTHGSLYQTF